MFVFTINYLNNFVIRLQHFTLHVYIVMLKNFMLRNLAYYKWPTAKKLGTLKLLVGTLCN